MNLFEYASLRRSTKVSLQHVLLWVLCALFIAGDAAIPNHAFSGTPSLHDVYMNKIPSAKDYEQLTKLHLTWYEPGFHGNNKNAGKAFLVADLQSSLTYVKTASPSANVAPGSTITHTLIITNTGQGVATNVGLTETVGPYVYWSIDSFGDNVGFLLTDGENSSGLTLGTPLFSSDNGATWTYTPVSGGGGAPAGYDGNVTNWQIPMVGTMNANGSSFTINYKVQVK